MFVIHVTRREAIPCVLYSLCGCSYAVMHDRLLCSGLASVVAMWLWRAVWDAFPALATPGPPSWQGSGISRGGHWVCPCEPAITGPECEGWRKKGATRDRGRYAVPGWKSLCNPDPSPNCIVRHIENTGDSSYTTITQKPSSHTWSNFTNSKMVCLVWPQ